MNYDNYINWLYDDIGELRDDLAKANQTNSLNIDLVKRFAWEFKKFLNGRLLQLKIIHKDDRKIIGLPVLLTENGLDVLPHPLLDMEWELSRPIESLSDKNRFSVGDIIAADFTENRNEHFMSSLLFVDFDKAVIVPQTLRQVLSQYVDKDFIERAYELFEVENQNEEVLKALITEKLLDTNKEVRQLWLDDLKQLREIRDGITQENDALSQEEEELDQRRKEWHQILKKIDSLIEIEDDHESIEDYESLEYQPIQFTSNLQSLFYNNDNQQLLYKEKVIKSFVHALQANILTLFAGPSGTGKSSIVQAFGRAVENVEIRMIPVQSSWTDTQDLLGYFHPNDKAFIPTPFMEAMAEAALERNKSKLFIICLDEMNLAHIEYYFSEILSAREDKSSTIHLYPRRYWVIAKNILKEDKAGIERKQSAEELIRLYPPTFRIPENVRFVGTLNMDHTVKPLSPKVIDRSFIIEINHLNAKGKKEIKENINGIIGKIKMNYEMFKEPILNGEAVNETVERVQEISNLFEDYPNASLNSRGYKHIRRFLTYANNSEETNDLIDYIILGKLLPRIEIKKSELNTSVFNSVLEKLEPYHLSFEKFRTMLNARYTIKFW